MSSPGHLRIVIDTGVVVSAALLPRSTPRMAIDLAMSRGLLLVSNATLDELDEVLRRPKFDRYVSRQHRMELRAALGRAAEVVAVSTVVTECRDAKDNKFLELVVDGRATHLVSGDADLLVLSPFHGTPIVTPQQFIEDLYKEITSGTIPGVRKVDELVVQ